MAVRRRRKANADLAGVPEPTPDKQMQHPSGWCMTGHHDGCRYQFNHGKCGCSCHVPKPKRGRPRKVINEEQV